MWWAEIFPSQAQVKSQITSELPVILKVCCPLVRTVTAIVFRQVTGLRIDRGLGKSEATEDGLAKEGLIRFVSKEPIGQQLFNTVREEKPILNRLKCRTITNPPVFYSGPEAVSSANEGNVVLVLKLIVSKKLRQVAA